MLFLLNPESAHHVALSALRITHKLRLTKILFPARKSKSSFTWHHLQFSNRVGLAAGFDKNAAYLHEMAQLGFGHIETGTVTPLPQPGNDMPRLFRLTADEALINRMGFNNQGADVMAYRLSKKPENLVIGVNIGKNKTTPNEDAISDYLICFRKLYEHADYFTVNVSSPNTPGLRDLQDTRFLSDLIIQLDNFRKTQNVRKPVLLKIAPDLSNEQLHEMVQLVNTSAFDGIVATNTTLNRNGLKTTSDQLTQIGMGGLSGKPLFKRSLECVQLIHSGLDSSKIIIAAGGILSANEASEMLNAGASLVQIYTGFIYKGPGLVNEINQLTK